MHGTMSIYNAWCDRAPVIVMGGTDLDAANRPPGVPTTHSGQDINALVRDFTKWDDTPVSLAAFRAIVRARLQVRDDAALRAGHARARCRAAGNADAGARAQPAHHSEIYAPPSPPQAEVAALRETAKLLVNAERPVIVVDRVARTPDGLKHLVELAELLQAPVVNMRGRMNFPNSHHLSQPPGAIVRPGRRDPRHGGRPTSGTSSTASPTTRDNEGLGDQRRRAKPDAKLITISSVELNEKSNYQDFQRFQPVDIADGGRRRGLAAVADRGRQDGDEQRQEGGLREARRGLQEGQGDGARARHGGGGGGVGRGPDLHRAAVGGDLGRREGSRLVAGRSTGNGPAAGRSGFFKIDKHYQWIGGSGGSGHGYGVPASVGGRARQQGVRPASRSRSRATAT